MKELYYTNTDGLSPKNQEGLNLICQLSASDKLLGNKITDITYNNTKEWDHEAEIWIKCPEIQIDLDNGSQINITMCTDGSVLVDSD